jgi:hypothetical protein
VIQDHWDALDAAPASSEWLTSALPVEVDGRSMLCARGPEGKRHLLTPMASADRVEVDLDAAAVHLVPVVLERGHKRVHFADLRLVRSDLEDVFTGLCAEVVAAVAASPEAAFLAVSQVLDTWRELFRSGSRLSLEAMAGLFAELSVLEQLLIRDGNSLGSWKGPFRAPQDFTSGSWAIEVKATTSAEGSSVRIHGMDQLVVKPDGGLMLWWMRLDVVNPDGRTIPEQVEVLKKYAARPQELLRLLARAGYYSADAETYGGVRFTISEQQHHRVLDDFPRIVPESFPEPLHGISDVRYTLDLSECPALLDRGEVKSFLDRMVQS